MINLFNPIQHKPAVIAIAAGLYLLLTSILNKFEIIAIGRMFI